MVMFDIVLWHMHNAADLIYDLGEADHTEVTRIGQRTTAKAWPEVNKLELD